MIELYDPITENASPFLFLFAHMLSKCITSYLRTIATYIFLSTGVIMQSTIRILFSLFS